jgi:hypothetical protein
MPNYPMRLFPSRSSRASTSNVTVAGSYALFVGTDANGKRGLYWGENDTQHHCKYAAELIAFEAS